MSRASTFEFVLVNILRIGYIIKVAASLLAIYDNAELRKYRVTPTVERGAVERLAVAQILVAFPAFG